MDGWIDIQHMFQLVSAVFVLKGYVLIMISEINVTLSEVT